MQKPIQLRCEYFLNPVGIDAHQPRLSWQLDDPRRGARQTAYQVLVATSPQISQGDLWDSGRIESDQSTHVPYGGTPLRSRQKCWWKVRSWDGQGIQSPWSDGAFWEMGLLEVGDWMARWIGSPILGGPFSIPPSPYLRKEFSIGSPIADARLYVTALGLYEFEINGQKAGRDVFAPGRTEYRKRVPYHVYDVTSLLQSGSNAAGAILGDGWYCGHLHSDPRQTYGDRPRLLAQLEITANDGSKQTIVTDSSWKTGQGPIRSSDMLMGEDYDARLEIPGWSKPKFDDSNWSPAIVFDDPGIAIVAHRAPPMRRTHEVKPIAPPTVSANKRRWLFDLGQNIVGRIRLKVRTEKPGQVIDVRYAEMLDKDGKPYTLSLRSARATDHYTTRGGAEEIYEPHFTFHGFRYVELRDYPGTPTIDDVTGIVLQSDLATTGGFECSDPMINQLQRNIVWSQRGNFLDIPTDCPQRDERLGWTGDAQVFIRTAAFNMDVANFFTKWLTDVADAQGDDGRIPSVVPDVKSLYGEGGPAWADAAIICPWTVYLCYGDSQILRDCYPTMQRFMGFLEKNCVNFIRADEHWKWKGYGDWLSINAETPSDFIGTAFYGHCARLMSQIAAITGKSDDAEKYRRLFEDVRRAWQKRFISGDGLTVKTQTAYVLALHFDLLPAAVQPRIVELLAADIAERRTHLSTGFVGTPYLNHVLARFGRPDVAYALLMQKTFPSWLYPITQGATTMWERWDAWTHEKGFNDTGMNSFNHYAFGAIGEWMYSVVGGIDLDPQKPAYKHILIAPRPGDGITWARTHLDSMFGRIESNWQLENNRLHLDVLIPPNTTASVRIATANASGITESGGAIAVKVAGEQAQMEIPAGKYSFVIPNPIIV